MGLLSDYQRVDAGRIIQHHRNEITAYIVQMTRLLDDIVVMKTTYPEDLAELNGYLLELKTALTNLINRYA